MSPDIARHPLRQWGWGGIHPDNGVLHSHQKWLCWSRADEQKNIHDPSKACQPNTFDLCYLPLLLLFRHPVVSDFLWPPWTAARQASLSLTISQSLPKLMFISSEMPSNHHILWCPLLSFCPQSFPASGTFLKVDCLHQMTKILELQLQHQSFQWVFRVDFP